MKKILLGRIFALPSIAFAISGACSYHEGVNCSAGMSASANAICNDGTESSVMYIDMKECMDAATCTPDEYQGFLQKEGATYANTRVQQDSQQIQTLNNSLNLEKLDKLRNEGGAVTVDSAELEAQILGDNQPLLAKISSLNADMTSALNDAEFYTTQAKQDCSNAAYSALMKQSQNILNNEKKQSQVTTSYITNTSDCSWAPNSHPFSSNGCQCDNGYVWNNAQTQCIEKAVSYLPVKTDSPRVSNIQTSSKTNTVTSSATSSENSLKILSTSEQIVTPPEKHWYDWLTYLNPFTWFKK